MFQRGGRFVIGGVERDVAWGARETLALAANTTIAGTGLGDILVSSTLSAGRYRVTVIGSWQRTDANASTVGCGLNFSGTLTAVAFRAILSNTAAGSALGTDIAANNTAALSGSETANGAVRPVFLSGAFSCSTSGTLAFRMQRSSAAQANAGLQMLIEEF